MHPSIRLPRWAVGLALASACVLVATAQVHRRRPRRRQTRPSVEDIPFASPNAAAVTVASAPERVGRPAHRRASDAVRPRGRTTSIEATLDPKKHTIDGKQQLTWRNRSDRPVSAVYLHLYLNAFEGPGSTFNTEKRDNAFGFRSDVGLKEGGYGYMRLQRVAQNGATCRGPTCNPTAARRPTAPWCASTCPKPVAAGGSTTLDIDFFDQLPRVSARTGYYGTFHLVGAMVPEDRRARTAGRTRRHRTALERARVPPAQRVLRRLRQLRRAITVPKGYTVGATGEEQGKPVERGGKVTHRSCRATCTTSRGPPTSAYAKPLDGVYNGANGPVKVRVLYHPEYASNAKPVLEATIESLTYFSKTLGDYPYSTVTAVVPPYNADEAGGMEYPTFFTASSYKPRARRHA